MKYWLLLVLLVITTGCSAVEGKAGIDELQSGGTNTPEPTPVDIKSTSSPAVTNSVQSQLSSLPDLGEAPELTNTVWLNSDKPLRLADLRGKVVLVDMWTFG
jgi:hypothetical protein